MKPAMIFTTAAILTAGIISFVQFSPSDSATQNMTQVAEATQNQPAISASSELGKATPLNVEEKKSEPVAENKPSTARSDAAPSSPTNATSNQAKSMVTDTTKTATHSAPAPTPTPAPTPAK